MKRSFEWVRSYERDLIDKDRRRDDLFNSMWNMAFLNWDFSKADRDKMKNVRTLVDTNPSNALHNAAIALSNTVPYWEVAPYGTSLYEYQNTERMEHCLSWTFNKMNQRGVGTLLFDKMWNSLLYDMIVTRIDDLEFQFKGVRELTPLQKHIRSKGRFLGQVFDPRTIHCEFSMGTFTSLLHVENMRAWDVYEYWKVYENNSTREGKMVAEAVRKMEEKFTGKKQTEIREMRFIFYEFYSHDQILKHGHFFGGGQPQAPTLYPSGESSRNDIVFADEENDLGFMNWSVRIGGTRTESEPAYQVNPMLAPLHWGNSWETINILRSLIMSEPIKRMLEEVRELQTTRDGQVLPVNDDGVAVGFTGETIQKLPTSPLDPNTINVLQSLEQEIVKTTGANVLSDVTSAKTTPFATLNAMIQVAMSRLDINRRDGALSCADDALIMLQWSKKLNKPLMSYRKENKTMSIQGYQMQMQAGEQVVLDVRDFDLEQCDISVDIKPKTPTDFQQQVLTAIQLNKQLKIPWEYVIERFLGVENTQLLKNQWEDEQFSDAEMQAAIQNMMQQEQMRAQMQQQQMMQPPQTQMPSAGAGIAQSAMGALGGGQGVNPAMMGASPQAFEPGLTRENISGQTQGGEPIVAGGD